MTSGEPWNADWRRVNERENDHMSDLTDFLLARIAEDEWEAKSSAVLNNNDWQRRALAECESKRRIVALHSDQVDHGDGRITHTGVCDTCGENVARGLDEQFPCDTLLALAQPYRDHAGFRPAGETQ